MPGLLPSIYRSKPREERKLNQTALAAQLTDASAVDWSCGTSPCLKSTRYGATYQRSLINLKRPVNRNVTHFFRTAVRPTFP